MHNFIQSNQTIGEIYYKAQLDVERLLMHLFWEKEEVENQAIYTSTNTSTKNRV